MTEIDDLSTPEELQQWGIEQFYNLLDNGNIPEAEPFSDHMCAFVGLRGIKKASRRWKPDGLPYQSYLIMSLREDYKKFAEEGQFTTGAEKALQILEDGAA